jgi:hypothetical protein
VTPRRRKPKPKAPAAQPRSTRLAKRLSRTKTFTGRAQSLYRGLGFLSAHHVAVRASQRTAKAQSIASDPTRPLLTRGSAGRCARRPSCPAAGYRSAPVAFADTAARLSFTMADDGISTTRIEAEHRPDAQREISTAFNLFSDPNRTVSASQVWFKIRAPK